MNTIEDYINSVYKNVKGNQIEIEDLKQDMRSHLLQTVNELKLQGKTEAESIEIAINRFGKQDQVETELLNVFKVQKKFATNILVISIISLLLTVICFFSYKISCKKSLLVIPDDLRSTVENKLEAEQPVSDEEITQMLTKYKKQFRYVALFSNDNRDTPKIVCPSNFSVQEIETDTEYYLATYVVSPNNINWEVRYGFKINGFDPWFSHTLSIVAIIFFVVYWILFGIWCIINAYHKNRLSITWILLFFIFNVIAYMMFKLDDLNILKLKTSHC
jgi:hypothetical protein